jgi:hypothetical protein
VVEQVDPVGIGEDFEGAWEEAHEEPLRHAVRVRPLCR